MSHTDRIEEREWRKVWALEHLAREAGAIQDVLEIYVRHQVLGGLTPEEVAQAKAQAEKLKTSLAASREKLEAAIAAQGS